MEPQIRQKVERFFSSYKPHKLKRGDVLIRAGETPFGVHFLVSGVVRQYAISHNGEEVVLNIFKAGAFFPMSWVISDIFNNHYYEAVTDIVVKTASKQEVKSFIEKEPRVMMDLLKRLYKGIEGIFMHIEHLMSGNAHSKLSASLLILAKRFGKIQSEGTLIDLKMTEAELAAYSGITRETASREIVKLTKKGLIVMLNHHFIIKDLEGLRIELESST